MNFFCEKDGKNKRDSHFSNLAKFVHAESLVTQLKSNEDLVNAIHKRQELSNQHKKGKLS
jgi:hypothetical protein